MPTQYLAHIRQNLHFNSECPALFLRRGEVDVTDMETLELLPKTEAPLVLRTDFEDQDAWDTICALIRQPVREYDQEFYANVVFLENRAFLGLTAQELLARIPDGYPHTFLLVADAAASRSPEYPVLVIDLARERGRTFRAIPAQIQGIENNLSIANMDFESFADCVSDDGVFRGFRNDPDASRQLAEHYHSESLKAFSSQYANVRICAGFLGHAALEAGLKVALFEYGLTAAEKDLCRRPDGVFEMSKAEFAPVRNLVTLATRFSQIQPDFNLQAGLNLPPLQILMRSGLTVVEGLELFDQFSANPGYSTEKFELNEVGTEYALVLDALLARLKPYLAQPER
jgi:hypothetical protein